MQSFRLFIAAGAIASLSACLNSDLERGAVGAVAGAVIADASGGDAVAGAVIGGTAGAFCDEVVRICR